MDFLKKFTDATDINAKEAPTSTAGAGDDKAPSQAELYASAQVVAEAAKATFQHEPTNVDSYKLAGAASDILDAAQHYGKLDSSGVGGYVEKAEGYLKQYESSHSPPKEEKSNPPPVKEEEKSAPPPPAEAAPSSESPAGDAKPAEPVATPVEEKKPEPEPAKEETKSEGGVGDYVKVAEGLLNKKSEGDSGSGYGDALKAAGSFFK